MLIHPGLTTADSNPAEPTKEELENWFNTDDPAPPGAKTIIRSNDGQLEFIPAITNQDIVHSQNTFTIDKESIDNGWVKLKQCYQHLAPIPRIEVVYQYRYIRNLKIHSIKNIKNAYIAENQSVQLENVSADAKLCITAEVRNFYQNEDKTFSLVNGPYHRKFFDGYYPYHLTLDIRFTPGLKYLSSRPLSRQYFPVLFTPGKLYVDTWFKGMLNTEFQFALQKQ